MDQEPHGNRYGAWYGLSNAPRLVTRRLGAGSLDVARLTHPGGEHTFAAYPEIENALLLHVQLNGLRAEVSLDGERAHQLDTPPGGVNILDLRQEISGRIMGAFDTVIFHMPAVIFEALAEDGRGDHDPGASLSPHREFDDPVIRALTSALLPALDRRQSTSALCLDYIGLALAAHVAHAYGVPGAARPRDAGALAPWQERRAKAMIEADLGGELRLADLARACGLSVGYFSRAFRRTTGTTPHRWLTQRRIDRAKALLARPEGAIALECGFADQAHFTRAFGRWVGVTPAASRRGSAH
jgi:AraC family transcriptional regulator